MSDLAARIRRLSALWFDNPHEDAGDKIADALETAETALVRGRYSGRRQTCEQTCESVESQMNVCEGKTYTDGNAQRRVLAIFWDTHAKTKLVFSETVHHSNPEFIGSRPHWRLSEFEAWAQWEVKP